jgi:hypothetical protein
MPKGCRGRQRSNPIQALIGQAMMASVFAAVVQPNVGNLVERPPFAATSDVGGHFHFFGKNETKVSTPLVVSGRMSNLIQYLSYRFPEWLHRRRLVLVEMLPQGRLECQDSATEMDAVPCRHAPADARINGRRRNRVFAWSWHMSEPMEWEPRHGRHGPWCLQGSCHEWHGR